MKTASALVLVLLAAVAAHAGVTETEINGRYRHQVRQPNGLVVLDQMETLHEGVLSGEHWSRCPWESPTQRVVRFTAQRDAGGWRDVSNECVSWNGDGTVTTNTSVRECRGFLGGRSSGSVVWATQDGYRTLMVACVEFELRWTTRTDMCVSNEYDRGCSSVSVFRYQRFPQTSVDLTNLAACTLNQYKPGQSDNSVRRVPIPIPLNEFWVWRGRDECYYCQDGPMCWHPHWGKVWSQAGRVAAYGRTATVTLPAPSGMMATILRSTDLGTWKPLGTVEAFDGAVTFTDEDAPLVQAFYRWEEL
jgi:hypothetical protein